MSSAAPASTATFGETLKFLRKRAHLTQRELSIAVGYSETYITRLENDTRPPDLIMVKARFVEALDLQHEPHLSQRLIDLAVMARTYDQRIVPPASLWRNTNLMPALTRFIGRQRELHSVIEQVKSNRLVTLTGAGGVGKTRLAMEAGMHLLNRFADGVQMAELASISDAALVAQTVAGVFKIANQSGRAYVDVLRVVLAGKNLLLILDNCEHVIGECATLADALLRDCPTLHILATSREALNIHGEVAWRVPSMNTDESAQLFVERVNAVKTDFAISEQNAGDVTAICTRLDGIPLAIELAASRLSALSVKQLAARLNDRFNLLTNGSRTALQRHQTLRALITWSYDLLSDQERTLLRRLAVFADGCTAESAEAVCATPKEHADDMATLYAPNVLPLLLGLVNKSLVIASDEGEQTRYTMLETIKQFAWEQLELTGEREWACRQHFTHWLSLAEQTETQPQLHVSAGRSSTTLDRIQQEHDNLRAALDWIMDQQETESALRLVIAMCPFWEARGFWSEGRYKLQQVLTLMSDHSLSLSQLDLYAQALMHSAILAWRQSDYAAARQQFKASLARFQTCGDMMSAGSAMSYLGGVSYEQGDYALAREFYEQALAVWESLPNAPTLSCSLTRLAIAGAITNQGDLATARQICEERLPYHRQNGEKYSLSYALNRLASILYMQGDLNASRPLYEESLMLRRLLGNKRGIAATANELGNLHAALGEHEIARSLCEESLAIYQSIGNRRGMASVLSSLARFHMLNGDLYHAAILLTAVEVSLNELQALLDEPIRSVKEYVMHHISSQLEVTIFNNAKQTGAGMTFDQAVAFALSL